LAAGRRRKLVKVLGKIAATTLLALLAAGCAQRVLVQPVVDTGTYHRLAVLPLETDSYLSTVGNQLADEIVVNLLKNAPQLDIVERTRVDAVVREQDLARAGYISQESAIAVGKMLGVRAILTGSVSVSIGDIQPTPLNAQRVASGTATVRLIDTQTGKILWGDRQESQYSTFIGTSPDQIGINRTDQEMVQEVLKELARSIAQSFYPHFEYRY
jgi:TolB-like protein